MPTNPFSANDLTQLRSLASRGDKMAALLIRAFDTTRSDSKEVHLARAATTANRTLSGLTSTVLDGVTPVADDLILVRAQTEPKDNGLYLAAAGAWTRLKDDQGVDVLRPGMLVDVREGSTLADTQWSCTSDATVIDTDDIVFAQLTTAVAQGALAPTAVNSAAYFAYEQDFPLAAGSTIPVPLTKDVHLTASGDYLSDAAGGVYSLATAAVSEAQAAQLTFGNQLIIDPSKGPIFEARVRVNIPGATISADERWVVGLCSDHTNAEDALDSTVSNVWFRGEGANLNIFIEGDDGTTDTDDTDSTIDYVDNTYLLFKIDMTDLEAVEMSIDGVAVGTTLDLAALTGSTLLQPIFCYQRDAGTEINLLQIDWFRVTQSR
jgi:hypothetical protein